MPAQYKTKGHRCCNPYDNTNCAVSVGNFVLYVHGNTVWMYIDGTFRYNK